MKAVLNNLFEVNTKIAFLAGMVGGLFRFVLQYQPNSSYWPALGKAAFTAMICGAAGAAGGWIFRLAMKWIRKN